jgi:hypothetical protein
VSAQALPELASVPWRQRTDARWLHRWGGIWQAWTVLCTVPFVAAAVGMMLLDPIAAPVSFAALAHAWIIPELYAFRGAGVVRPPRASERSAAGSERGRSAPAPAATVGDPETVAQGLLGDLLGHDERELQRTSGLALEHGTLGVWLVGHAGALLVAPGSRRVHCFCVRVPDAELPPSDRVAHLLLALRVDEEGFATVANHAFAGASWRVRRRLPKATKPALDAARRAAR